MRVFIGALIKLWFRDREILVSTLAYTSDYFVVSIFTNTVLTKNSEQCCIYPCNYDGTRTGVVDTVFSRCMSNVK